MFWGGVVWIVIVVDEGTGRERREQTEEESKQISLALGMSSLYTSRRPKTKMTSKLLKQEPSNRKIVPTQSG